MSEKNINTLLSQVSEIVKSYDRLKKITGERLNLFSLLRKETDEVRLHSKFIAELLNPKGAHDQGTLFLDLFLDEFNIDNIDSSSARVYLEFYVGVISRDKTKGGNIDILIDDGKNLVKIENKINAKEQVNQLLRYHNYRTGTLLFLTLYGNKSEQDIELLSQKVKYKCISYQQDIINWLTKCVEKVALIPNLRESIVQYKRLIKKLTKQNINYQMNTDITQKITDNKENFEAYLSIRKLENDNSIYNQIISEKVIPFLEKFSIDNGLKIYSLKDSLLINRKEYAGFYLENDFLQSIGLIISVEFEKAYNNGMYYGLQFTDEKVEQIDLYNVLFEESKKLLPKTRRTKTWLTSAYWDEYLNWSDIDTLFHLAHGNFQMEFEQNMLDLLKLVESVHEKMRNA